MKAGKKTLIIIAISLIIFLVVLVALKNRESSVFAEQGIIDYRQSSFSSKNLYKLNGTWDFYPESFIKNNFENIERKSLSIAVPASWNEIYKPQGFGSYKLEILLPQDQTNLELLMPSLSTAYSLYINGEKMSSNGNTAMNHKKSHPEFKYSTVPLENLNGRAEIVLHVSNFEYSKGGMWTSPLIGKAASVEQYFKTRIFSETLIAGGVSLVGLILLTLFLVRRQFISYANLGLFCLIMGIRTLIVGEIPMTFFFPDFSWPLMIRLEYLTMSVGFIFINSYFYNIYKNFYKMRVYLILNSLAGLFSILILFSPIRIFTGQVHFMQLIILAGIGQVFYLFFKSGQAMKEENTILLSAFSIMLFMVILDIFKANNYLNFLPDKMNTSYGLIILILSNSFLLIRQASRMTSQLLNVTSNLEQLVHKRTEELEQANKRLSIQAVTDLLTGVSNRHKFTNVMKTEEARFQRYGIPYAALYLDLDNFKFINDTFGHPAGDLILKKFAFLIQSMIRNSDYMFRLGGDEFFILMPDVPSLVDGESLALRILKEIRIREGFKSDLDEFLGYSTNIPREKKLSLSIGVSSTALPGIQFVQDLPVFADKALLRAKSHGKNCCIVYSDGN